jgi:hypothetical protein
MKALNGEIISLYVDPDAFKTSVHGAQGFACTVCHTNFKRSVALLQLSYKDLTGQDVPGATLMK